MNSSDFLHKWSVQGVTHFNVPFEVPSSEVRLSAIRFHTFVLSLKMHKHKYVHAYCITISITQRMNITSKMADSGIHVGTHG